MTQTRALAAQPTAVRRAILAPEQLLDWIPRACAEVAGYLHQRGITPSGYPYARWHRLRHDLIGVEAGLPVPAPIRIAGRVEPSELPPGPVVVAWHTGPHEQIALTYQEIDNWLESTRAEPNGDGWEVYHDLPTVDHSRRHIEVVQPLSMSVATV
jgi:effector-binding domain-containing protein